MKTLPSHQPAIAWLLLALVLFHGLACSLGHGLMMGNMGSASQPAPSAVGHAAPAHAMHRAMDAQLAKSASAHPAPSDAHHGFEALFAECAFAGMLTLALIAFAVLGWLSRTVRAAFALRSLWDGIPFRIDFPTLNPRAP